MNGQRHARRMRRLRLVLVAAIVCTSLSPAAEIAVKDRTGAQIVVPHETETSLLLFLRAGQAQSLSVVENVRKIVGEFPSTQVVVIFSGQVSGAQVSEFAAAVPWPIVLDSDYSLVGTFKVRAWPTTAIVAVTGTELTRLSGLPRSHAEHVEAYLAFAAGKIDQQTLNRRLSSTSMVADSPYQVALRHLQVSQRLMDKGLTRAAGVELDKALNLQPDEPRVQLARARLMLLLGQPTQAMAVLATLDDTTALTARIGTRKGQALVMLKQWDEAIVVLERAAKLNPNPGEAMYLLGVAYQQTGRWTDAAAAFRKAFEHTPAGHRIAVVIGAKKPARTAQPASPPQSRPTTTPAK